MMKTCNKNINVLDAIKNDQEIIDKFKSLLPSNADVKQYLNDIFFYLKEDLIKSKNPLLKAHPEKLMSALYQCACHNLSPSPIYTHVYLSRQNDNVVLDISYKGLLALAMRSQLIKTIDCVECVYASDSFEVSYGLSNEIKHAPDYTKPRKDADIIAAYAICTRSDGKIVFRVVSRADIDRSKDNSKSLRTPHSPWIKFYPQMAMKTAILRLLYLFQDIKLPSQLMDSESEEAEKKEEEIIEQKVEEEKVIDQAEKLLNEIENDQDEKSDNQERIDKLLSDLDAPINNQVEKTGDKNDI